MTLWWKERQKTWSGLLDSEKFRLYKLLITSLDHIAKSKMVGRRLIPWCRCINVHAKQTSWHARSCRSSCTTSASAAHARECLCLHRVPGRPKVCVAQLFRRQLIVKLGRECVEGWPVRVVTRRKVVSAFGGLCKHNHSLFLCLAGR